MKKIVVPYRGWVAWSLALLLPLAWVIPKIVRHGLGVNPVETLSHLTGRCALNLLVASLAITPLRKVGIHALKYRRTLGLAAFAYAVVHLLVYFVFDAGLSPSYVIDDVAKRRYITLGMGAFLLLLPLALTSTQNSIKRLGRNWTRLHRMVYLAVPLVVAHFYGRLKADFLVVEIYAAIVATLLVARLWPRPASVSR